MNRSAGGPFRDTNSLDISSTPLNASANRQIAIVIIRVALNRFYFYNINVCRMDCILLFLSHYLALSTFIYAHSPHQRAVPADRIRANHKEMSPIHVHS